MFENMVDVVQWIFFGLVVGLLGRLLVPGRQRIGLLATIGLGVAGSLLGGFVSYLLFRGGQPIQGAGWIMSTIGAVVVLLIGIQLSKPSTNLPQSR